MEDILKKFNLSYENYTWFDCESFDDCDNYIGLFEELLRVSAFRITLENIQWQEGWSEGKESYLAEVSFDYKSHTQTIKVSCDGWFDPDLIINLNSIIDINNDFEERFYPIETGDQTLIIAFLNMQQYSELRKNNLIADIKKYTLRKDDKWDTLRIAK